MDILVSTILELRESLLSDVWLMDVVDWWGLVIYWRLLRSVAERVAHMAERPIMIAKTPVEEA